MYSIGIASKLTGFSERQIRYYEKKGLIKPGRTKGGNRIFYEKDIKLLLQIKKLREQGLSIQKITQRFKEDEKNVSNITKKAHELSDVKIFFREQEEGFND